MPFKVPPAWQKSQEILCWVCGSLLCVGLLCTHYYCVLCMANGPASKVISDIVLTKSIGPSGQLRLGIGWSYSFQVKLAEPGGAVLATAWWQNAF